MENLAEQIKSQQTVGFNKIVTRLDSVVKDMCLQFGSCTIGYSKRTEIEDSCYFSVRINERYKRLAIEHYRSEGFEVEEFSHSGFLRGIRISL